MERLRRPGHQPLEPQAVGKALFGLPWVAQTAGLRFSFAVRPASSSLMLKTVSEQRDASERSSM